MTADEYLKARVEDQIDWYDSKSQKAQQRFKGLRLGEIGAAAAIPVLSGYMSVWGAVPVLVGTLGALVAVIAGALGLFQFEHNWIEYRTTCEVLKKEKFLFLTGSEPFGGEPGDDFQLLVQRVEALVSKENTHWAQQMMTPHEEGEQRG